VSFRSVAKRVYYANHLGSKFAEEATFRPGNGEPERRVWMSIAKRQRVEGQQQTEDHNEEFEIEFGRDPKHEKGGVDFLIEGAEVIRDRDNDPGQKVLRFTGEITEERPSHLRAIFTRHKRIAQGRGR
jgi:hypothetical protein